MNPERNRGGMTVNALMQWGLVASTAIPVISLALLGFASLYLDHSTLILATVACAIIVLLGVMIVNYFIQHRIRDRIQRLVEVCRDYASGDRTARAAVNGDDDFAMLSMSINTLLDSQGGSSAAASLGSIGSDAAALQAQIEKLLQEVSAVGDGDLRVQAEVTPDTLGVLADSFNYMIEELAKVVGRVQSTAVQVTNATRRILDRTAELTQASEAQVAQISQTTEAVEALAIFIQNVARNAQLSAEMAQEALGNAATGQQSVRQTIEGMMLIRENVQETSKKIKRLGERSNEIGEIVRIIEDIADQTNLLALNAAIQSAMAGEHGRGFAVVADEIRLLAERSTESTKRIATLVKSIQGDTYEAVVAMEDSTQEVVKGSQLADEAGRALNSIYGAVERQAQMIESIARAAKDQTSVSESVAMAMGRISEITRQTDAGTQEAAVSVSYLAELSEQLRASVSTFRLPDRGGNEMLGSFPHMTSVGEVNDHADQMFTPSLMPSMDTDWGQGFAGNFPPLPEPGNSGSLVSLSSSSRSNGGQYAFSNQQDFGAQGAAPQSFTGPFGTQQQYNNQQAFGSQPFENGSQRGFSNGQHGQQYGNQQSGGQQFGGSGSQQYGNQQPGGQQFGGSGSQQYGNQQPGGQQFGGSGSQQYGNQQSGGQQFGNQQNFGDGFDAQMNFEGAQHLAPPPNFGNNQNQPFYQNRGQAANPGLLPAPGQATPVRPRWQAAAPNGQNAQNQGQFNQDQTPFPNNG
ncbi:MAG: methyl-accepting chemotaxis protein [Chloroflexota bacterium]|nr:methyl-accepting chemotaxis protein [Chloroflexota bacterium]